MFNHYKNRLEKLKTREWRVPGWRGDDAPVLTVMQAGDSNPRWMKAITNPKITYRGGTKGELSDKDVKANAATSRLVMAMACVVDWKGVTAQDDDQKEPTPVPFPDALKLDAKTALATDHAAVALVRQFLAALGDVVTEQLFLFVSRPSNFVESTEKDDEDDSILDEEAALLRGDVVKPEAEQVPLAKPSPST